MGPDRKQRISTLFESALRLPAESVEDFLRRECSGDKGLWDEVRRMLRARVAGVSRSTDTIPTSEVPRPGLAGARLKDRYLYPAELGAAVRRRVLASR